MVDRKANHHLSQHDISVMLGQQGYERVGGSGLQGGDVAFQRKTSNGRLRVYVVGSDGLLGWSGSLEAAVDRLSFLRRITPSVRDRITVSGKRQTRFQDSLRNQETSL